MRQNYIRRMENKALNQERDENYEGAIETYNRILSSLTKNYPDENYKIARFYEKLAACYERLCDIKGSAKCYTLAAKHYLKIGYKKNAELCLNLRKSLGDEMIRLKFGACRKNQDE